MKYILLVLPFICVLASCSKCNQSSPDGVANCVCSFEEESEKAREDGDIQKAIEVYDEFEKFKNEVNQKIEEGDYTGEEIEDAIRYADCHK